MDNEYILCFNFLLLSIGVVPLHNGEIAEDLTHYLLASE